MVLKLEQQSAYLLTTARPDGHHPIICDATGLCIEVLKHVQAHTPFLAIAVQELRPSLRWRLLPRKELAGLLEKTASAVDEIQWVDYLKIFDWLPKH